MRLRRTLAVLVGCCAFSVSVSAATLTWQGTVSNLWSEPANWSPAAVPQDGDSLIFPNTATQKSMMNDLTGLTTGPIQLLDTYVLDGYPITLAGDVSFSGFVSTFTCNTELTIGDDIQIGNFSALAIFTEAVDVNGHVLTIGTTKARFAALNGTGTITDYFFLGIGGGNFSGTVVAPASDYQALSLDVGAPMPDMTVENDDDAPVILSGNGTVGTLIGVFSFYPGTRDPLGSPASAGTLDVGSVMLARYDLDLFRDGTSDLVRVHGTVTPASSSVVLYVNLPTGNPAVGQSFTIMEIDGTEPAQLGLPEQGVIGTTSTGVLFRITYRGGDGNDVVLTRLPAPLTWTGSVSGAWSNPNNWSPAEVPSNGADLSFPAGAANKAMTNDLTGLQVGTILLSDNAYSISGNPFLVLYAISVRTSGTPTLTLNTTMTFGPDAQFNGKFVGSGALDVNGQTLHNNGAEIDIALNGTGSIVGYGLTIGGGGDFSGTINTDTTELRDGALPNAAIIGGSLGGAGTVGDVTFTASSNSVYPGIGDLFREHNIATLHTKSLTLGSYAADVKPGTGSDVIQVTGSVTLGSGTLAVTVSGSLTPGQSFTIIDNDGSDPVNGTFANLPEGGFIDFPPVRLQITYHGGDGNDVVLNAVTAPASTTTLTVDPPDAVYMQPANLVATVTAPNGVPTGTVTFRRQVWTGEGYANNIYATVPLQNGVATTPMQWTTLICNSQFPDSYSATYDGSASTVGSTSGLVSTGGRTAQTQITVTSSKSPSAPGENVTFTATAIVLPPSQASTASLILRWFVDEVVKYSGQVGTAGTFTTSFTAGSHTVRAELGSGCLLPLVAGSVGTFTQIVAPTAATVSVHSTRNPSPAGDDVKLVVDVSGGGTVPTGVVTVGENGATIAQQALDNGTTIFTLSGLAAGDHQFVVKYNGDSQHDGSDANFTQTVQTPSLSVLDLAVLEGNANSAATVQVRLSAAVQQVVTVNYATADGTAKAGQDYVPASGTLTFSPGETVKTIPVMTIGDATAEDDEAFTVSLSQSNGVPIEHATATVTILNDDASFALSTFAYASAPAAPSLTLDVYTPVNGSGPFPVVLWIPGSASYAPAGVSPALRETRRGYIVVVPSYRTPAQAVFPAQVDDLKTAIRWIRANAAMLRTDRNRIAVWGSGTGAHLAALVGTTGERATAGSLAEGNASESNRVQAVIDWGGASDLPTLDRDATLNCVGSHDAPTSQESQLIGCSLAACPTEAGAASPLSFVTGDDPPFLIVHGGADCIIPAEQSRKLYTALLAAGARATLHIADGVSANDAWWYSAAADTEVDAFLDASLRTGSVKHRAARH